MRLFHVSENSDIGIFNPKVLERRKDLNQGSGWVWAVNQNRLYNFFFPTDCPRLSTFKGKGHNFLKESDPDIVVYVEEKWQPIIENSRLTIYEFETTSFKLQDETAGYYISEEAQLPINKYKLDQCFYALSSFDIEVRYLKQLWHKKDEIEAKTNNYSFRKMINASK